MIGTIFHLSSTIDAVIYHLHRIQIITLIWNIRNDTFFPYRIMNEAMEHNAVNLISSNDDNVDDS